MDNRSHPILSRKQHERENADRRLPIAWLEIIDHLCLAETKREEKERIAVVNLSSQSPDENVNSTDN